MRLYTNGYITVMAQIITINLDKNNQNNTSNLLFFREYLELLHILFKNER